ncbi:MAG: beta-galactosidase, partial [Anaerolineae bacterium]|nr:beta-galactosidase [Anaerolineae bacterium]
MNALSATTPPQAGHLAADKGYGVTIDLTSYDDETLDQTLEALHTSGLTWLRQPIRWAEIEPEPGQYRWQSLDRITQALADINQQTSQPTNQPPLKLIAVLHTAPRWAREPHTISTAPPMALSDFGDFAAAFAARYGSQIAVYQIWDEPNLSANWGHTFVDAPAYGALLREAALRIRAVDSDAVIMAAALAPTLENGPLNLNEIDYLDQLYQVNADRWFDIVAAQPYGFDREPSDAATSNVLNFRRIELLRQMMLRHGDVDTPIWATAFGWNALPADWAGPKSPWKTAPPDRQARRTTEAIDLARQNWPWLGPMLSIRWDSTNLEGNDPAHGFSLRDTPPVLAALQIAATGPTIATPGTYPADHPSGHYSPGWRWATQQTDIPRNQPRTLTIEFEGKQLDLAVNRGDFRGYLWVTIDGRPANALPHGNQGRSYVVLYDPLREPATITLAHNLPNAFHRAEITAEGGWGQWAIAGWSVSNRHDPTLARIGMLTAGIFIVLSGAALGKMARRDFGTWSRFLRLGAARLAAFSDHLDERLLFAFTAVLAIGLYFGFGRIILLLLLTPCLLLRPDFGLILITFGLSFLPNTKGVSMFDVPLLEAVLALSALGVLRQLVSHQPSAVSGQR